jgi:ABC-type branched-chain amino acid transport systems, periplasmic component
MNNLSKFLIIFFLVFSKIAEAQVSGGNDVVVEVSKEKVVINGKTFFLHKVKKGENLYRISRAYNVTQKDIIIANPETISGNIKEGQTLKIPTETGARNISQIESDNFIYHIAEEKQTIYYIAQKYKITQEELFKYNPELQYSKLQVGQVVKIPKVPNAPVGTDKFRPIEKYVEYKVGRKETMYSISKDHNITVDELIAANPILNTGDLKKGQIIQIPVKSDTEIIAIPIVNIPDTVKQETTTTEQKTPCENVKAFSETIKVAILLPIFIEGNETLAMLDSAMAEKGGEKMNYEANEVYQLTANLLEFYEGALMAIDSLKKAGMSVKLYVYDTGRDNQKINSILAKPEMAKVDLIIGPLTYNQSSLDKVAQFAQMNKIKMVSPVSTNIQILKNNPYVFQINANESVSIDVLLKYISATFDNKNIILINSNKESDRDTFELFKNKLNTYFPNQFKIFNYNDDPKLIDALIAKNTNNLIIFPSEQEAIINKILNHLNFLPKDYNIKVYGLSIWTIFKGIEQEFLHNLEFQYTSSFYVNFDDPRVKSFFNNYKLYYKTEPTYHTKDNSPQFFYKDGYNMAFLGYDITFYFLNSIGRLGRNFENCLGQQKIDLLHTNIIFDKLDSVSGYLNKGVDILKYTKEYKVIKAN